MEKSDNSEKRVRHPLRILRPLFWWLMLVLVFYGIRLHQRWVAQTRLNFSVSMQGRSLIYEATTMLDGKPAMSGQLITLGSHNFTVTHPKGESFSTNLFIWYGEHNLGTIDLKRTKGTLAVAADPPAPFIYISGPEWSVTLTNSYGVTNIVPTDQYTVRSSYAHWRRVHDITVYEGSTASLPIAPRLGAVRLSCNQSDATYQLLTLGGQLLEAGSFPVLIIELPEGSYTLNYRHHDDQRKQTLVVKAGTTNDNPVEFLYGAADLETEPPGASVQDGDGREWGITPLKLTELQPVMMQMTIHRRGYETVPVSLQITPNQTATFRTNLISTTYTGAMKSARAFMAAANYNQALQSLNDAPLSQACG